MSKNIDVDVLLAIAAEKYTEKLKEYEPGIRTILQEYFEPTEDQVKSITKAVYRHLPLVTDAEALKSQRKMLIDAHENLAKTVKSYQETVSGLMELLFHGPGRSLLEDLKEEIDSRDITRGQFMEALLVLAVVAKRADVTLNPARVGAPIEEISRFACEVNLEFPQLSLLRRANIISMLLRDLADTKVTSNNIRDMIRRCPKRKETPAESVVNSWLYG